MIRGTCYCGDPVADIATARYISVQLGLPITMTLNMECDALSSISRHIHQSGRQFSQLADLVARGETLKAIGMAESLAHLSGDDGCAA